MPGTQQITVTPFQDVPPDPDLPVQQVTATARYIHTDGTVTETRIVLFQTDDNRAGIGFYPEEDRGTVLRLDDGTKASPTVVPWRAPHCEEDDCGSPCRHRRGNLAQRALAILGW